MKNIILTEQQFNGVLKSMANNDNPDWTALSKGQSTYNVFQNANQTNQQNTASQNTNATNTENTGNTNVNDSINLTWGYNDTDEKECPLLKPDDIEKAAELDKYIKDTLKLNGKNPNELKLSPQLIVTLCKKHNFSIPFLVAQAHLESHFGTTDRAKRTNSVFSVGSYDSGKNACTYPSQNSSIEPYINLIKNDYLTDGKTLNDLLKPGAFVNKNGYRYASDKNYEKRLLSCMNRVLKFCPGLA